MIGNIFRMEKNCLMSHRLEHGSEPYSIVHETGGAEWDLVVGAAVNCLGENLVAAEAS